MNSSKTAGLFPVIAALAGNTFITLIKFLGFLLTGSSAMFSEAIHGLADTGNQALLMIGIKRSLRDANADYHYGFGQERFFWALISACGIFFLGAGVTLYHGVTSLFNHEAVVARPIIFLILGVSVIIEVATLVIAYRELKLRSRETQFFAIIREGDPATLAVLYEDGVAVLGSVVAMISISLTILTGSPLWDAIGSIIIGVMLAGVALILIKKNREFLLKKAMPFHLEEEIVDLLMSEPTIEKVIDFKSSVLDIDTYRITCDVEFNGTELLKEINKRGELREDFAQVCANYSEFVRFCTEISDRAPRLIGTKINEIEKRIRERVPQVKHIDIEIN